MTRKQKKMLLRIAASALLLIAAVLLPSQGVWRFLSFLPSYFVIGWDVLWRAVRNILHGQVFDENFLMALATIGAFCTGFFGEGEYPEAVFVMLFYQVGELFQGYAVGKSRRSISSLMDIRPDYANIEENGALRRVDPQSLHVGDVIVIKAGEKVPLDGMVLEGASSLDTSALTGEALPREVGPGDDVISGCVNQSGLLRIEVKKEFGESTVSRILDLVENAGSKKAKAENFITRFARFYTPVVVLSAVALGLIPPIFLGNWANWISRALIFLVVSCPCALVISVPLSFFGGIGGASREGILIKGGNYLEALSHTETVVFDKTGTLTQGVFKVTAVYPEPSFSKEELLELAALAESYSEHPISRSLREACKNALEPGRVAGVQELSGRGVKALVDGRTVWAGNDKLMEEAGVVFEKREEPGTVVYVAEGGAYAGAILISDEKKPDAKEAVALLKAAGVKRIVMLTGDAEKAGKAAAQELGIREVFTELLPADKVREVERLLEECSPKGKLAFVGDGINDAPVLSRADIGIAMGALGSDAAIEAADIVLMDDKPSKLAAAMEISRKTLRIVRENIIFALGVKVLVLLLSAFGLANMWAAVFADVGVSVIAILNAMRALKGR